MGGAAAGNQRGSLVSVLTPWLAVALFDVYLVLGGWPRPAPWQFVAEVALFAAAGRTQWRLARGWLRSPLLPAGVVVVFALLPHAPRPAHQVIPFLVGLSGGVAWIIRTVERRWSVPVPGAVCIALVAVLGARWLDVRLLAAPTDAARPSIVADVLWPLAIPRPPSARVDAPPVIVISIDTLRTDAAQTMDSMRRLGARGVVWPRAMSTSSWTLPALASLQTGLLPAAHGAGCLEDGHCQGLFSGVRTLAEALTDAGWVTAAFVNNPWVGVGTGFHRGFATFREFGDRPNRLVVTGLGMDSHIQDDAHVIDAALAWLDDAPARGIYLWVHLLGPHMPYLHSGSASMRSLDAAKLRSGHPPSERTRTMIREAYRAEVAYTDRQVMRLLDALEARDVLEEGVVVLTSDHGEEFWEHDGIEHGHSHHGEVVDVPLALVAPGLTPDTRRDLASLLDVASTIRAIAGLEPRGLDLRSTIPPTRTAGAWGGIVLRLDCSVRGLRRRVIAEDCVQDPFRLRTYDLARDPEELAPAPVRPDDPLLSALATLGPPAPAEASSLPVDRLRALGYLQ